MALAAAISGCSASQNNLTPAGPPLTSAAGIAAERATLAAAGSATHQLAFPGAGMKPEDRVPVFANPSGLDRVFALDADEQEQLKIEMARGSFACWPRAGSPVRLVRENGNVAWIEVTAGDRAGCTGVVKPSALADPKFLDELHNNLLADPKFLDEFGP